MAGITLVQSAPAVAMTNVASVTQTFSAGTTVGNTIIVCTSNYSNNIAATVVSGAGVTNWIKVVSSNVYDLTEIWYGVVVSAGQTTVTVSTGVTAYPGSMASEWLGVLTPSAVSNANGAGTTSIPAAAGTLSSTGIGQLVVATVSTSVGSLASPYDTSGWTLLGTVIYNGSSYYAVAEYVKAPYAGGFGPIWSLNANSNYDGVAAVFQQSRTQTGIVRIRGVPTKTQPSLTRVRKVATKTQSALVHLALSHNFTQTALVRLRIGATKTQGGMARVNTHPVKTQTGVARTRTVVTRTQNATSRLSHLYSSTQTGHALVAPVGTVTYRQSGRSRIQGLGTATQTGVAHILAIEVATGGSISTSVSSIGNAELYPGSLLPGVTYFLGLNITYPGTTSASALGTELQSTAVNPYVRQPVTFAAPLLGATAQYSSSLASFAQLATRVGGYWITLWESQTGPDFIAGSTSVVSAAPAANQALQFAVNTIGFNAGTLSATGALVSPTGGTIFGTARYGTSFYGDPGRNAALVAQTFSAEPVTQSTTLYALVNLGWTIPNSGVTMQLVRNSTGTPVDHTDGLILLNQPRTSLNYFVDRTITPNSQGQFLYYSLFVQDATTAGNWWRAADWQVMLPYKYDYGPWMFSLLPEYYRNLDSPAPDGTDIFGLPQQENPQL